MNIDYARLGAQVLYVSVSMNIVYVAQYIFVFPLFQINITKNKGKTTV